MPSSALRVPRKDETDWSSLLAGQGYCIIPDLMPAAKVRALHADLQPRLDRTPFCEGSFYGQRTKRFGGLLKRTPHAAEFVQHPLVLDAVQTILGPFCDRIQLNLAQIIDIWPGEPEQVPHRDQDMWGGPKGEMEYLVNVIWPLSPFRRENGATVLWPGSHGRRCGEKPGRDEAVYAEMDPGSALLFLGSAMHCGGANRTQLPRTAMVVGYSLGWLKPHEAQWLVYPPDVARTFAPDLAALVGYQQHRPNLGNYEGQCPSVLLRDDVPDYLGAVDSLRDDQVKATAEYKARQMAKGPKPL